MGRLERLSLRAAPLGCSFSVGSHFIFYCFFREAPLAEADSNPLHRPLRDGIVPEEIVARTEKRWVIIMASMLGIMMAIIVATGIVSALHPSSNVEVVDPQTLHLNGEFVESNLGTAAEPDGSVTVRIIAEQYDFVPNCVRVPVDVPVKFRLTSADVVHGFLIPDTNVNTMVVPGFVSEVRTHFSVAKEYQMPCHEFCGLGHQAMWAHVIVVPKEQFAKLTPVERAACER
jgi:cytochrome c oxidase subunit 2